ncbi:MAG: peptidase M48 [Flavobacteriaceae bacterium]|nr:peptidase M48 [Flavobacteriaceae bacterium]|tara:strand:+ start:378288 stop:379520 length:1233 start_codon:yes stop_codon:yes gene_type:complete
MTSESLFYLIIIIVSMNFLFDRLLHRLNVSRFNDSLPKELSDIYEKEAYQKSQAYKKTNAKFSSLTATFSFLITMSFLLFDGFRFVDAFVRQFSSNTIVITLLFFGIIMIGLDILTTPFSYYRTFVIEEKFGFNKSTKKTFWLDKLKGWLMTIILGGTILGLIVWFYELTTTNFWLYTWLLITVFSVFMNFFYAKLIVPIFNKQTPLEDGSLKNAIQNYASKVGFKLDNIFVIDGSKRSTKANAYFSGFGAQKRITLYDTLINDLEEEEIVAVLAHEVGHYKRNHIIYNLILSTALTGLTLYILSLTVSSPLLSNALGVETVSFHIGLIAFGILYSPISEVTSLFMNVLSRKFEYQADDFAKHTFDGKPLVSSLKKLSKNSLSNLTPHPAYVFVNYSHPTLYNRILNLDK